MKIISAELGNQNIFGWYWKEQGQYNLIIELNQISAVHKLPQSWFLTQNKSSPFSASIVVINDMFSLLLAATTIELENACGFFYGAVVICFSFKHKLIANELTWCSDIDFGSKRQNFIHSLPKYQNTAGLSLGICRNKGNNLWSFSIFNRLTQRPIWHAN